MNVQTKRTGVDLNVVLMKPEIPHNTGAIGRLCVGLDIRLHLVRPLGFTLYSGRVKRAGLDYWEHVRLSVHDDWEQFLCAEQPQRLFFASTRGTRTHYECRFRQGDYLVFGSESSGLPEAFYEERRDQLYRIPMPGPHARSLNLANAVSVVVYEAYRQLCGA